VKTCVELKEVKFEKDDLEKETKSLNLAMKALKKKSKTI